MRAVSVNLLPLVRSMFSAAAVKVWMAAAFDESCVRMPPSSLRIFYPGPIDAYFEAMLMREWNVDGSIPGTWLINLYGLT